MTDHAFISRATLQQIADDLHFMRSTPDHAWDDADFERVSGTIEAADVALAAPCEPVARFVSDVDCGHVDLVPHQGLPLIDGEPLYAAPKEPT